MGDAQHLAVIGGTAAALAPSGHMVRVHLGHLPYLALVGIMAHGAERAVGFAVGFRNLGLLSAVAETSDHDVKRCRLQLGGFVPDLLGCRCRFDPVYRLSPEGRGLRRHLSFETLHNLI